MTTTLWSAFTRLAGVTSLALAALAATPAHAQAQNYSPMRFDLGLVAPYGLGIHAFGIGAMLEAKYNITDQIDAGLRLEGNAQLGGSVDEGSGGSASLGAAAYLTVLAKGEYFFTTTSTRPFVGLGAGLYHLGGASESGSSSGGSASATAGTFFGLAPQVGVNFGGFRLALAYNHIFTTSGSSAAVSSGSAPPSVPTMDYMTLDLAFQIGGGRIGPAPSLN